MYIESVSRQRKPKQFAAILQEPAMKHNIAPECILYQDRKDCFWQKAIRLTWVFVMYLPKDGYFYLFRDVHRAYIVVILIYQTGDFGAD